MLAGARQVPYASFTPILDVYFIAYTRRNGSKLFGRDPLD